MKKFTALLMTLTLTAALLAGCGQNTSTDEGKLPKMDLSPVPKKHLLGPKNPLK